MFQEFVNRTGVDAPGIGGWRGRGCRTRSTGRLARRVDFPSCSSCSCSAAKIRSITCSARARLGPRAAPAGQAHLADPHHRGGAPPVLRAQYLRERVPALSPVPPRDPVGGSADRAAPDGAHDARRSRRADSRVRHPARGRRRGVHAQRSLSRADARVAEQGARVVRGARVGHAAHAAVVARAR